MLPVAIFHALATSEYNKETGILVGIMFVMLVVSFSIGFLLRPLMPAERYRKYLPLWSVYTKAVPWPILYIPAFAERRIFPRSLCWILQVFCLASASIWECSDRWKRGKDRSGKTVFQCNTYTGVYCKCAGNHCRTYRCGAEASCRTVCRYLYKCGEHSHHFHNLSYSAGGRIQH